MARRDPVGVRLLDTTRDMSGRFCYDASAMLGLGGKPVKRREFITLAPAQQPARCRLSRSPSAQREAQMFVRLSIGAFAAILMLPTTLSAQVNPGGGINPGGAINPGAINPGGDINPGGATP